MPADEIELLDRVLLRLGVAETDEQLEATVGRFLTPVIIKITTPHDNVREKVVDVLTHIKRRLSSRPKVQLPVEALLDQYKTSCESPFLQNFAIIFITMGFTRLSDEKKAELAPKLLTCEEKLENYQDRLFVLLIPLLNIIPIPEDPEKRKNLLGIEDKPGVKKNFLALLRDVLLLPYTSVPEIIPAGFSKYSYTRIRVHNWKSEELEELKKGLVRFLRSGVFADTEIFILLVVASADTRFSVATPAISELNKICTGINFRDPVITSPLYSLFSGNMTEDKDRKTSPCCARVRQKLLQYLVRVRGKGLNTPRGIRVIFEGLFGEATNQKCRVLVLQFCEMLIREGPIEIISKVAKVILVGLLKLIAKDTNEPNEVQNATYAAIAQLARTCPEVINQDLKIVLSYFNNLTYTPPDVHGSIRDALVAMAPAFAHKSPNNELEKNVQLSAQEHLLLAMLTDNAVSKLNIVQNVTSVFLTTCFPEHFPPARFLLLLIAGERNSLRETVTSHLYGVSKKDQINYNYISSIDYPETYSDDFNKLSSEQRRVMLPGFKPMVRYVMEMNQKRLAKGTHCVLVGKVKLAFGLATYEEILHYLRLCLWFSAGIRAAPGDKKSAIQLRNYILENYSEHESNELFQYLQLVQNSVEAQRNESNLLCLYDLLNAVPEVLSAAKKYLMGPLSKSLSEISETSRIQAAELYGIIVAYSMNFNDFNNEMTDILSSLPQKTLESRHGWMLALAHAYSRRFHSLNMAEKKETLRATQPFTDTVKTFAQMLCDSQPLMVSAAVTCISLIGREVIIPTFDVQISIQYTDQVEESMEDDKSTKMSTKHVIFGVIFGLLKSSSVRAKIREESAKCLGCLAIGDSEHFTVKNLNKFLSLIKVPKDAALNIAISEAIVATINGYDTNNPNPEFVNPHCDEAVFENFLNILIKSVTDPNPHSRQSCAVWLLAIVRHCSHRPYVLAKKQLLQLAFTELLSDDSEFVQDVSSRGLGLVYNLSDTDTQNELANSLLEQLTGGKKKVAQVNQDTELFAEGLLGKTPTGGNMTTYKELCSLASDLNKPDMIYQFMQLANHNAIWTSKLGAAFGLKSISKDAKVNMQPYLGKIIPRLYRYKYDPTPKIQNSMISIWDCIVNDSKAVVEQYYWEILREILDNLTFNEWRVRIACCLATRDLLKRPNGLRLRCTELANKGVEPMDVDNEIPEPEIRELWFQLFRVMDDIHEGTRHAAQGTVRVLSKICISAVSSDRGKSGLAVASSILPLLLDTGVTHTVADIRKISIHTISEMIDSSGSLISSHLSTLIPCLLRATGELESTELSYLSTRLGAETEAQEAVDSIRAEAAKSHRTMEITAKCIRHVDYPTLEKMTPEILELIKTSLNLGTKIACAHFVCLTSLRLGKEMTPLVSKYLGACFTGLKDRNATVRKYYASAIGHLIGIAKEQSVKNLFTKLEELYTENPSNRGIPHVIRSINKRHQELLKDYTDNVLPLIFFAMHEERTEENKSNIELWKDLWTDLSPGDSGIRLNLRVILPKLEAFLDDASWLRKAQSANAIKTIATRLTTSLEEAERLRLINILLVGLQGRTYKGKERLLEALASLCKDLDKKHEIRYQIIEVALREGRKKEPQYRIPALVSLGDILEVLEADQFEDVYNMLWPTLEKKDFKDDEDDVAELTADERNKKAHEFNKLKETITLTLGKAWPKSKETQEKFQEKFAADCCALLKDSTRQVQVALLTALTKFVERLIIFDPETDDTKEKKPKIDPSRDMIVKKICGDVLSAVTYASSLPHTGLKKESLNIVLILVKRLADMQDKTYLAIVSKVFEESLQQYEKDAAPEVRCRIKDIEDKISKTKN